MTYHSLKSRAEGPERVQYEVEHGYDDTKSLRSCMDSHGRLFTKIKQDMKTDDMLLGILEQFSTGTVGPCAELLKTLVTEIQVDRKRPLTQKQQQVRASCGGGVDGKTWWECLEEGQRHEVKNFDDLLAVEMISNFDVLAHRTLRTELEEDLVEDAQWPRTAAIRRKIEVSI